MCRDWHPCVDASMRKPPITYANVTATLALVLALGGTSYAAAKLPKNSVSSKQIAANAVRSPDVKDGALTGADLGDGSLTGADVKDGALGAGELDPAAVTTFSRPRAWGVYSHPGLGLVAAKSSGNVTVTSAVEGIKCLTPNPGSGITAADMTVIATVDLDNIGSVHGVETDYNSPYCPGGVGIITTVESSGDMLLLSNSFSFVIP